MMNLLNISYSESCQTTHNLVNQLHLTNRPIIFFVVTHQPHPTIVVVHQPDPIVVVAHQTHPTIVVAHQPHPIIVITHQPESHQTHQQQVDQL